jgi:hypothetical protein
MTYEKRFILLLILLILAGSLIGCSSKITVADIRNITVSNLEAGRTVSITQDQFNIIVDGYNNSTRYRDDIGTTYPLRADILLGDGRTIIIWGGIGDFLAIEKDGKQHNIVSEKLGSWFGRLE